ncbi:MAG: tetratricopeptide repeat protein [Polyangia bacterium]|jgi:tetratricopeptide (TPR) repeat protein|nr:tetratricopeptide repeat protein [Polyangia bacterium]
MNKIGVALSVLLMLAGQVGVAAAQTDNKDLARQHFNKGFAYYQNGEYLKAVKELKVAYDLRPVPVVLFYIGKTFQSAGLEDEAARALWKFLDEATLNDPKRAQAEQALRDMKKSARAPAAGIGDPATPGTGPGTGPGTDPRVAPRDTPPEPDRPARPRKAVKPGEIIHEPLEDARPGHPMTLEAELPEDFGDWARLYLYYRPKGSEKFLKKAMQSDRRGIYHGCVPKRHMVGTSIQYYIEAVGRTGKRQAGSGNASLPNIISLSPEAPLQPGGRLQGCPDDGTGAPGGEEDPRRPGDGGTEPGKTDFVPDGKKPDETPGPGAKRLKLYGFIATAAASVAAFVVGGVLTAGARSKAQDMANAGVGGPVRVFDGEVEDIEKQGKALDTGAVLCYVIGALAAGGAGYLAYEVFFKGRKREKAAPKEEPAVRITPTVGPTTWGLSGELRF